VPTIHIPRAHRANNGSGRAHFELSSSFTNRQRLDNSRISPPIHAMIAVRIAMAPPTWIIIGEWSADPAHTNAKNKKSSISVADAILGMFALNDANAIIPMTMAAAANIHAWSTSLLFALA
jgi:hypothetical protein